MKWDWRFLPRWAAFRHNAKQSLIAVDQAGNALIGLLLGVAGLLYLLPRAAGYWWADETVSAHCWRWHIQGIRHWPRVLVDGVAFLFGDKGHCRASYDSERLGRQLPPELRPDSQQAPQ